MVYAIFSPTRKSLFCLKSPLLYRRSYERNKFVPAALKLGWAADSRSGRRPLLIQASKLPCQSRQRPQRMSAAPHKVDGRPPTAHDTAARCAVERIPKNLRPTTAQLRTVGELASARLRADLAVGGEHAAGVARAAFCKTVLPPLTLERLAGDEARLVAGEIDDGGGDVVRRAPAAGGDAGEVGVLLLLRVVRRGARRESSRGRSC